MLILLEIGAQTIITDRSENYDFIQWLIVKQEHSSNYTETMLQLSISLF